MTVISVPRFGTFPGHELYRKAGRQQTTLPKKMLRESQGQGMRNQFGKDGVLSKHGVNAMAAGTFKKNYAHRDLYLAKAEVPPDTL